MPAFPISLAKQARSASSIVLVEPLKSTRSAPNNVRISKERLRRRKRRISRAQNRVHLAAGMESRRAESRLKRLRKENKELVATLGILRTYLKMLENRKGEVPEFGT